MDGKLLGFDYDLLVTMIGLLVAGLAAIIGIWVERDPKRPPRYAIWLSVLIAMATGVGMFQTWDDDQDQKKVEGDLARVLQQLDKIATANDVEIPELNELIKSELAAQSRANPRVVQEFAQRIADEGDDPGEVVAAYLPASEVENIERKGTLTPKPKSKGGEARATEAKASEPSKDGEGDTVAVANPEARKQRRKRLSFGGGPPKLVARPGGDDGKPTKIDEPKKVDKPAEPPSEPRTERDGDPRDKDDKNEPQTVRLRPGADQEKPGAVDPKRSLPRPSAPQPPPRPPATAPQKVPLRR